MEYVRGAADKLAATYSEANGLDRLGDSLAFSDWVARPVRGIKAVRGD
jgi:hypothetical protein